MSRNRWLAPLEYKPVIDLNAKITRFDPAVKLPHQHRLAVERAEDLIAGRPPRPVAAARAKSGAACRFPTGAEMDAALRCFQFGLSSSPDPDLRRLFKMAREGAQIIKARRREKPRKTSKRALLRAEALLQAVSELPPKFKKHLTGKPTVERLRLTVSKKVGLLVVSEAAIRHDIREVRPLLRLIQAGKPFPLEQPPSTPELSEQTRQEMECGRAAVARAAAAPPEVSQGHSPSTIFEKLVADFSKRADAAG